MKYPPFSSLCVLSAGLLLSACASFQREPEESRAQDARVFTVDGAPTTFAALAAAPTDTVAVANASRWAGVLGGAAYQVEVPDHWNGKLVMYAHGYRGTGPALTVTAPPIRRYLLENGYAWAASSYSKNYYDVRAGVEDTNALALAFTKIAASNGRALAPPIRVYITGHSMGGHVTAAAIENETAQTANNKVKYDGAVPMCGVMADTELFDAFAGLQSAAQALAGIPSYPMTKWDEVEPLVTASLFETFPTAAAPQVETKPTAKGHKFVSVLQNISGGERPLFNQGVTFGGTFRFAYGAFGRDGTVNGILNKDVTDSSALKFAIDGDAAATEALNKSAQKVSAAPDANRLRRDGLRWIPKVNGEIRVPVVSMHTLGDLYVFFAMQQAYQKRVAVKGNSHLLVQRAIRGAAHCDFTVAEQVDAFDAMVKWERDGVKPAGDDVIAAATVAAPSYGCAFTNNALGPDDSAPAKALRQRILAATPACPAR